ncbi:TetR/AcrR family transcriptional regulator [Pimelobacter simplex]|uniref:TetR/AcrR family transcriptional regulator n=1 Tax=Nocardioides simplex TaxID=2045 RepID=A0A7J5E0K9_NOCSI|nr:TetR/AcrR family transcriptional regulator [Pimelobacter simplex]KAB2811800.1 TetR/AcrR family transcriptional regulator [Pimelobacter simplex]
MATTPRERARAQTMADITRIGRQHLAEYGAAALSLRAVARDLGVVSSAVYRYVKSRDELLTLLLVDGYDDLGDAVARALAAAPGASHGERFLAFGHAIRDWARAEPATYALLYGAPVPGYHAPAEQTTGPGTRVVRMLLELAAAALADDALRVPAPSAPAPPGLAAVFEGVREQFGIALPDDVLVAGMLVWAGLFGCVSFEVFGQYGPEGLGDDGAELFTRHLVLLGDTLGLAVSG